MKNLLFLLLSITFIACKAPAPDFKKDGGIRYILQMDTTGLTAAEIKATRDKCTAILSTRLEKVVPENSTLENGPGLSTIRLELPGKYDVQRLRKLLQSAVKLSFCETYTAGEMAAKLSTLNSLLEIQQNITIDEAADSVHDPLFTLLVQGFPGNTDAERLPNSVVLGLVNVSDTARVSGYMRSEAAKNTFGPDVKFLWSFKPQEQNPRGYELIAIKTNNGKMALSGDILQDARKVMDGQTARLQISVTMTADAAETWKQLTRRNQGRAIAVVIDDQVYSYPVVQGEIAGGQTVISGDFTQEEADEFVNVLRAGYMPVRLSIVSEELVPGSR